MATKRLEVNGTGYRWPDRPIVVWLQDLLDEEFGEGAGTVICPITDAFVGHHGALGGFVRVYCHEGLSGERVAERIRDVPGLEPLA